MAGRPNCAEDGGTRSARRPRARPSGRSASPRGPDQGRGRSSPHLRAAPTPPSRRAGGRPRGSPRVRAGGGRPRSILVERTERFAQRSRHKSGSRCPTCRRDRRTSTPTTWSGPPHHPKPTADRPGATRGPTASHRRRDDRRSDELTRARRGPARQNGDHADVPARGRRWSTPTGHPANDDGAGALLRSRPVEDRARAAATPARRGDGPRRDGRPAPGSRPARPAAGRCRCRRGAPARRPGRDGTSRP